MFSDRKKKLKSAEQGAQSEIATFRAEIQAKFEKESNTDVGSTKSYQGELDLETKSALDVMTQAHQRNRDKIVDLLVYHSTTVQMKVPDNIVECMKATMSLEPKN